MTNEQLTERKAAMQRDPAFNARLLRLKYQQRDLLREARQRQRGNDHEINNECVDDANRD